MILLWLESLKEQHLYETDYNVDLFNALCHPVEKYSICWLGMFWTMAAGLSWFKQEISWLWDD